MSVYSLIGMASYAASIGFGIGTAVIGVILTGTRILDGVTDPMLAFLYDKVNTKFGKIRILMIVGFAIEAVALLCMYDWAAGKGLGTVAFVLFYVIYVIGYTIVNMTAQTIPPLMTNDPKTASDTRRMDDSAQLHGSDGTDHVVKCRSSSKIRWYI